MASFHRGAQHRVEQTFRGYPGTRFDRPTPSDQAFLLPKLNAPHAADPEHDAERAPTDSSLVGGD